MCRVHGVQSAWCAECTVRRLYDTHETRHVGTRASEYKQQKPVENPIFLVVSETLYVFSSKKCIYKPLYTLVFFPSMDASIRI